MPLWLPRSHPLSRSLAGSRPACVRMHACRSCATRMGRNTAREFTHHTRAWCSVHGAGPAPRLLACRVAAVCLPAMMCSPACLLACAACSVRVAMDRGRRPHGPSACRHWVGDCGW